MKRDGDMLVLGVVRGVLHPDGVGDQSCSF